MASPFSIFRKNQRVLMAVFGIMAMVAFVFMDTGTFDPGSRGGEPDEVVVTSKYFDLKQSDLARASSTKFIALQFLTQAKFMALVNQQLVEWRQQFQGTPENLINQLIAQQEGMFRARAQLEVTQLFGGNTDEDIVTTMILAEQARRMGVELSDQRVIAFVREFVQGQVDNKSLNDLVPELRGPGGGAVTPRMLNDSLRLEFTAAAMRQLLLFRPVQTDTPLDRWSYFVRKECFATAEVLPVRAEDFLKDIPKPSEAELTSFFERYRYDEPVPGSPEPGFKNPAHASFQYFAAAESNFFHPEKITAEQVAKHYEDNKGRYRYSAEDFNAPPPGAAPTPTATSTSAPAATPAATATPATTPSATAVPTSTPSAVPSSTKPAAAPTGSATPTSTATPSTTTTPATPPGACEDTEVADEAEGDACQAPAADAKPTTTATAAPSATAKPSATPSATAAPSATTAPAATATPSATPKPTTTAASSPAPTATAAPTPKPIATAAASPTASATPSATPVASATPSAVPTGTASTASTPVAPPPPLPSEDFMLPTDIRTGRTPEYDPLWKVEGKIRNELAKDAAVKEIEELFKKLSEELTKAALKRDIASDAPIYTAEAWAAIAKQHPGLEAGTTELLTRVAVEQREEESGLFRATIGGRPFTIAAFSGPGVYAPSEAIDIPKAQQAETPSDAPSQTVRYLFWKTKYFDAKVQDLATIRAEVERAWMIRKARDKARAEAEALAKKARESSPTLLKTFPDRGVQLTNTFKYFEVDLSGNLDREPPRKISKVDGVEDPGPEFMQTVFGMQTGEVATAMNNPQTVCYVIRLTSLFPSPADLYQRFAGDNFENYEQYGRPDQGERFREAAQAILADADVRWLREPRTFDDQ